MRRDLTWTWAMVLLAAVGVAARAGAAESGGSAWVGPGASQSPTAVAEAVAAAPAAEAPGGVANGGLLLIPDATNDRIMAFDAVTGNVVDPDLVPADSTHLATPKQALADSARARVLVSDQVRDVVQAFDMRTGIFLATYAPAGGPNPAVLDNITGIDWRANGELLVCVQSGANANSVARFDSAGAFLGDLVAPAAGGLAGPFDIAPLSGGLLVSSINTDSLLWYLADGTGGGLFAPVNNFPEQIARAANGNLLVANFSGTQEGIVELTSGGALVAVYDTPSTAGYRGVYELPNDHLLVTTGTGVHEIDRAGVLIETKFGANAHYIEYVPERGNYRLSVSASDATCAVPDSGSDGDPDAYTDLQAFGLLTDPALGGDDEIFEWDTRTWSGGGEPSRLHFYGANVGNVVWIGTNGYLFIEPGWVPDPSFTVTPLGDPAQPNHVLAPFWRDLLVNWDGPLNHGITRASYSPAGTVLGYLVEYDDAELFPAGGGDHFDFEAFFLRGVDDTAGAFEVILAYDNLVGLDAADLTIGLESADASQATQIFNGGGDPLPVSDGAAFCFDWIYGLIFADGFELGDGRLWSEIAL